MTSRQFYIILAIFIVSLKVQKLPSLMYLTLENNSYLLFFAYFLIDFIAIFLAFFVLSILKKHNFLLHDKNGVIRFFVKFGLITISLYFFLQGTLFYEAIQDLFSHVLFDNLPWTLFSLLLIFAVFYLASTGIVNIARNFELYFYIILFSYIVLAILGGMKADFSNILPVKLDYIKGSAKHFLDYNIWFGDFFLVIFLGANAKDIKLKWTVLVYTVSSLFVVFLVMEFNGIYLNYAANQPSLISTISDQSILGIDVGRVDWFLILITEIGSILSCGLCLHFAKNCLSAVAPKIKSNYILCLLMLALYIADVTVLVDTNIKEFLFLNFAGIFALAVKIISFVLLMLVSLKIWHGQRRGKNASPAEVTNEKV